MKVLCALGPLTRRTSSPFMVLVSMPATQQPRVAFLIFYFTSTTLSFRHSPPMKLHQGLIFSILVRLPNRTTAHAPTHSNLWWVFLAKKVPAFHLLRALHTGNIYLSTRVVNLGLATIKIFMSFMGWRWRIINSALFYWFATSPPVITERVELLLCLLVSWVAWNEPPAGNKGM